MIVFNAKSELIKLVDLAFLEVKILQILAENLKKIFDFFPLKQDCQTRQKVSNTSDERSLYFHRFQARK